MAASSSQPNTAITTPTIQTHELDEPVNKLGEVSCGIRPLKLSQTDFQVCFLALILQILDESPKKPHSRCSETFYRKEIEMSIKSGSSKTEGDRNKIIELLERMEDQSAADEDGLFHHSDEENEEASLVHRFSAIDISSASADDLLRLLTKKERDKFFIALKDPSSGLAQELLEGTEIKKTLQRPWWEVPSGGDHSLPRSPLSPCVPYGVKPDLIVVPTNLINQAYCGVSLLYNICAVLLAYTYVTRHLSMSPLASTTNDSQDQHEAREIFSQSVPFLVDRKSKLRHVSLTDAVISFWSRLDPGSIDNRAMLVLLEDVATFVRPRKVNVAGHLSEEQGETVALATDHPFATAIMAISDMSSLFGPRVDTSGVATRRSHIILKLTFYAAHILSTPSSHLHALADEINSFSKSMAKEAH